MNINRIDLNLFAVFDAIYTARSLTKAADVLCITQPAVSNSLARLRNLTNDPLFVRTGHTMQPTPIAENMIVPARQALQLMRTCVLEREVFDPAFSEKAFNFASHDILEASIMPRLVIRLQDVAPQMSLTNFDLDRDQALSAMASGSLDFFSDSIAISEPDIRKEKIASDRYVVIARKNHPMLSKGLSLDTFLKLNHVTVLSRRIEKSQIDLVLDKMDLKRNVKLVGQHFLTVPNVVIKTELVACLPYHLAKHYDIAMFELPLEMPPIEYFLHWHMRADNDLAHSWMRDQIYAVAKTFKSR